MSNEIEEKTNNEQQQKGSWKEEIILEGSRYQIRRSIAPSGAVFISLFGGFGGNKPLRVPISSLSDVQEIRDMMDFILSDKDLKALFVDNSKQKFKKNI